MTKQERQMAALKRYVDRLVYLSGRDYHRWMEANRPQGHKLAEKSMLDHIADRRAALNKDETGGAG